MREFLYDKNSVAISLALFTLIVLAIELGFRIGRRRFPRTSPEQRDHASSVQGSLLGILALLLGFTFSQSLQRYEARSESVVHEANCIGTTWLRSQFLPDSVQAQSRALLAAYLDTRIEANHHSRTDWENAGPLHAKTDELTDQLWALTRQAAREWPTPITATYVNTLNDTIDARASEAAAFDRHVPETVLWLLLFTFLLAGAMLGLTAGLAGHRASLATYLMTLLIVILVFIIIDLDRPRRGLIQVDYSPLTELQKSVQKDQAAARGTPSP